MRRHTRHASCERRSMLRALLLLVLVASCKTDTRAIASSTVESARATAADAAAREAALAPLELDPWILPLPVEGFADAVVSIPWGATGRRPVVVAAHGYDDRPEGQCDVWRF